MAHYSINIRLSIAVYILISVLLVAVGWGNLHQLAPQEELFNSRGINTFHLDYLRASDVKQWIKSYIWSFLC